MKILIYEDDAQCAAIFAEILEQIQPTAEIIIDLGEKPMLFHLDDPSYDLILSDFTVVLGMQCSWLEQHYDHRLVFVSGYTGTESMRMEKEYVWLRKENIDGLRAFLVQRLQRCREYSEFKLLGVA